MPTISVDDEVYKELMKRVADKRMREPWKAWSFNDILRHALGLEVKKR